VKIAHTKESVHSLSCSLGHTYPFLSSTVFVLLMKVLEWEIFIFFYFSILLLHSLHPVPLDENNHSLMRTKPSWRDVVHDWSKSRLLCKLRTCMPSDDMRRTYKFYGFKRWQSWVHWHAPIILATQEAETVESFETSLGNIDPVSKNWKENLEEVTGL
jgi:hypothetical protein